MNHDHRNERNQPEHRAGESGRYGRERWRGDESRYDEDRMQGAGGYSPRYAPEFHAGDEDRGGERFSSREPRFGEGREGGRYYSQGSGGGMYSGGYTGQTQRGYGGDDDMRGSRYGGFGGRGSGGDFGEEQRYGGSQRTGQYGNYLGYGGAQGGGYGREAGGGMERGGRDWGFDNTRRGMEGSRTQRRGPKGYTRSDERIKDDVCERLMQQHDVDLEEVSIEVQNGKVTLEGSVPERRMKHAIEDVACNCYGVRDVENRVRVADRNAESNDGDGGSMARRGSSTRGTGATSQTRQ